MSILVYVGETGILARELINGKCYKVTKFINQLGKDCLMVDYGDNYVHNLINPPMHYFMEPEEYLKNHTIF